MQFPFLHLKFNHVSPSRSSLRRRPLRSRECSSTRIPRRPLPLPFPIAALSVSISLLIQLPRFRLPVTMCCCCSPQHPRALRIIIVVITIIITIILHQLARNTLIIRRLDPIARHDAREGDADARGAVEPGGARAARQLLAQVRGEVVAVARQQVVGGALELVGAMAYDGVDLGLRGEREAMQQLRAEAATRGFRSRPRPVYACGSALVVAPICVFFSVDHDARVKQGGTYCPEDGGETASLETGRGGWVR